MNIEKLYQARKQQGLSQEDLAHLCGVSRQAVSKWESGQSVPDAENLLAISKALEVSIDYLFDNEQMLEQKVKVRIDYDDFMQQENKFSAYEYKSKTTILGLPLVHIHYSRGLTTMGYRGSFPRRKLKVAKGILAIGDVAIGGAAIGVFSAGILNFGMIGIGMLGLSVIHGGIYSFGIISIGYAATGIIAIGNYSLGIISVARQTAIGIVAAGKEALGIEAFGRDFSVKISEGSSNICAAPQDFIAETQKVFSGRYLPYLMRKVIAIVTRCN